MGDVRFLARCLTCKTAFWTYGIESVKCGECKMEEEEIIEVDEPTEVEQDNVSEADTGFTVLDHFGLIEQATWLALRGARNDKTVGEIREAVALFVSLITD